MNPTPSVKLSNVMGSVMLQGYSSYINRNYKYKDFSHYRCILLNKWNVLHMDKPHRHEKQGRAATYLRVWFITIAVERFSLLYLIKSLEKYYGLSYNRNRINGKVYLEKILFFFKSYILVNLVCKVLQINRFMQSITKNSLIDYIAIKQHFKICL